MNIVYPINGKNERMGSLFSTPKHLLLYEKKELILNSINTLGEKYLDAKFIIITNELHSKTLSNLFLNNTRVSLKIIGQTSSQVETLKTVTTNLSNESVMFVDCDIVPINVTDFDFKYPTVFTFTNTEKLLNYSNFKCNKYNTILDCNEKQILYKNAGTGIYYFPTAIEFNKYSEDCKSISECIKKMVDSGIKAKLNTDSVVKRFGTLQDIYIDNFSFRRSDTKDLSTGFTKNKVYKQRRRIIKIGETTHLEKAWYDAYLDKKIIPKIFSCVDQKLIMQYIERNDYINLDDLLDLISSYKKYGKLNDLTFSSYVDNISNHLSNNSSICNGEKLLDRLKTLDIKPTFCHGDLSVMNVIPTKVGLKLIDPLYSNVKFGSYELDIAKLCFSLKFYKNDVASFKYVKESVNMDYIDILIASESVRVSSYKKEYSFVSENLINELN